MQGFDKQSSVLQIIKDLNLDPASDLASVSVGRIWDSYADKVALYPRLQDLYTRRQACDNLLGSIWPAVDYTQSGVERRLDQFFKHLQQMRDNLNTEILRLEDRARSNRSPAVGRSFRTAPVMARGCQPNPNDRAYGGDPLRRTPYPQDF